MKAMTASRENVAGFLFTADIVKLQNDGINVNGLSFNDAAAVVFDLYANKAISNATATNAIKLLCASNTAVKTERYRSNGDGKILEYSANHNAYLFLQSGGQRELNKLIAINGEYI